MTATSADAGDRDAAADFDNVTIGEIPLGSGSIRIAGALLPQPTTEFDHTLGLEPYAVTYTGYIVFCNLIDCRRARCRLAGLAGGGPGPGGPGPDRTAGRSRAPSGQLRDRREAREGKPPRQRGTRAAAGDGAAEPR